MKLKQILEEMTRAYGCVCINDKKEILLREPSGHFGGYVWTFPKGRPDKGESPEQCALRELKEETGVTGSIIWKIPGSFAGDVTTTEFFLARAVSRSGTYDSETASIAWVSIDEALKRVSRNLPVGAARDTKVLQAVRKLLR
jgi:8-oxo-dGTP diphosphatase